MINRESIGKLVTSFNQLAENAFFHASVACITDNFEFGFWELKVQVPSTPDRTHHVVSALHYHSRNVPDFVNVLQQLVIASEKTFVVKIVVFNLSERQSETVSLSLFNLIFRNQKFASGLNIYYLFLPFPKQSIILLLH